jgi:hypothetical protein
VIVADPNQHTIPISLVFAAAAPVIALATVVAVVLLEVTP